MSTNEDAAGSLWVDYADVCWLMPSSFRDPIDHRNLRRRHGGLFAHAGGLRRIAASDTQSPETQRKLTELLDHLEEVTGTRRTYTSTQYPNTTPAGDHDDHQPAAPAPTPRRKRRRRHR